MISRGSQKAIRFVDGHFLPLRSPACIRTSGGRCVAVTADRDEGFFLRGGGAFQKRRNQKRFVFWRSSVKTVFCVRACSVLYYLYCCTEYVRSRVYICTRAEGITTV